MIAAAKKKRKSERERDAERKRKSRKAENDLHIPRVMHPRRRKAAERDVLRFLRTYFPETFDEEFTPERCAIVEAILLAAKYGGDQAIAAPRGDGKTAIVERVLIYCLLVGILRFPLIAAATGHDAEQILENIKAELEENDRLYEDYPEVCHPIRALEAKPNRANGQTVEGVRTRIRWSGRSITLPSVKGSVASGRMLTTRGMDAAIRGVRKKRFRPDLVLIDDPETRESAASEEQIAKRELIVEEDLGGVSGPGKRLARVMLTTIMNRRCLSWRYTDPQQRPSWRGKRFGMLERPPERQDLWEEYQARRRVDQLAGDGTGRGAHAFYLERREAMDHGAVVGNPYRFVADRLPDGSQLEVSALQWCYNLIADRGWEHFATEYNNDPPEEAGPIESRLSATAVQMRVSGLARRVVPAREIVAVTQGIDVGKYALHWAVVAWAADATGWVIDYGVQEVWNTVRGDDRAVDDAIRMALAARREAMLREPYRFANGDPIDTRLTLVDSGYRTATVYGFCRETGTAFRPAKGVGESAGGAARTQFHLPKLTVDRRPGDRWFLGREGRSTWVVFMDSDHWKRWVQDRLRTPMGAPGALVLFGKASDDPRRMSEDQKSHFAFAKHLTNEGESEEIVKGKGLVRRWKVWSDTVHWGDATYMAAVGASMCGVSLIAGKAPEPKQQIQAVPLSAIMGRR